MAVKSKRSKLRHDQEFENCVTKKMKEDSGLMYRCFDDDEELLLKYAALPLAMSLRKAKAWDRCACLEQKIEAIPSSSV